MKRIEMDSGAEYYDADEADAEISRLSDKIYALQSVKTTEGLSASEWITRTAIAERKRDDVLSNFGPYFYRDLCGLLDVPVSSDLDTVYGIVKGLVNIKREGKRISDVIERSAILLEVPSWLDIPEAILATQQRLEVVEKQLAIVTAERDTARSFISALVSVCDKNGTLPQWSTINLHNAKVALGQEAKLERQDSCPA